MQPDEPGTDDQTGSWLAFAEGLMAVTSLCLFYIGQQDAATFCVAWAILLERWRTR